MHSSLVANNVPLSVKETRGRKRKAVSAATRILTFQEMLEQDIEEEARNNVYVTEGMLKSPLGLLYINQ